MIVHVFTYDLSNLGEESSDSLLLWELFRPWKTLADQIREGLHGPSCLSSAAKSECCAADCLGLPIDYLVLQDQKNASHCPSIMNCLALSAYVLLDNQKKISQQFFFFYKNVNYIKT